MSATSGTTMSFFERGDGQRLAYSKREGRAPGLVWLGGFKSEMNGTKATALDAWAAENGRAFVRFDYFGHGRSSGDFREGTISRWLDDSLSVLDALTTGPQVLVGSSMGAWLALLSCLRRPDRVAALCLIAPATDFTEALLWKALPADVRSEIEIKGEWPRPSAYDPNPYPITKRLIEDGRKHLLLGGEAIPVSVPVRVLQGMRDPDVPFAHAMALVEKLTGDVRITLVKEGDHRLSRPADLLLIEKELAILLEELRA